VLSATHAAAAGTAPDEADRVLSELSAAHPGTRFTRVTPTPIPGLFEVWMNRNLAYVSAHSPRYFMFGRLFDTQTLTDLSAATIARLEAEAEAETATAPASVALTPARLNTLPYADAITTVRGRGRQRLVVFSDPGCGHCRRLEAELAALDDTTVHTFLVPFLGQARPLAIWCAPDRPRAWRRVMLESQEPTPAATGCSHPLDRNLALARELGVRGTPAIFWPDGSRTDGFIDRRSLSARLATAAQGVRP
jgi:thiol:disulfide interchange protein DsbC